MKSRLLKEAAPYGVEDKIAEYYFGDGEIKLDEKEEELAFRWSFVNSLMLDSLTDKQIINGLIKKVKDKYSKEISIATAYRDIASARIVFGPIYKMNKEMIIYTTYQRWLKRIEILNTFGKYKEANMLEEKIPLLIKQIRDDNEAINPKDYGNHSFYIVINNQTNIAGNGIRVDLNAVQSIPKEEITKITDIIQNNAIEQQMLLLAKNAEDAE